MFQRKPKQRIRAVQVKFLGDVGPMGVNGPRMNVKFGGDRIGLLAGRDHVQNDPLRRSEFAEARRGTLQDLRAFPECKQSRRHGWADKRTPHGDRS